MPDVLLLDGPLRGQRAPWSESGSIAYDKPGGGIGLYLIQRCVVFGRLLHVAACGLHPGAALADPAWNTAVWEFLASDLAKTLAVEDCRDPGGTVRPIV